MNLSEFYDHVVLRDLLEYTAPGIVVIAGGSAGVDLAVYARGLDLPVSNFAVGHPWHSMVLVLFFGYLIGHILTAIHGPLFRGGEGKILQETIAANTSEESKWFVSVVSEGIARQLQLPKADVETLLKHEKDSTIIRELSRAIVQLHLPDLYREHINRHSILSRFCGNVAMAIAVSVLAAVPGLFLLIVKWCSSSVPEQMTLIVTSIGVFLGACSIYPLLRRSARLRISMTKHTFELLYLDRQNLTKTPASANDTT